MTSPELGIQGDSRERNVKRVSREELLGIIHPESEVEHGEEGVEFVEWGSRAAQQVREFRTKHPGASLDASNEPDYKHVRMGIRGAVGDLTSHAAGMDEARVASLDAAAQSTTERVLKKKLIELSPDIHARINQSLAEGQSPTMRLDQDSSATEIISILSYLPSDLLADVLVRIDDINTERRPGKVEKLKVMVDSYCELANGARDSLIPPAAKARLATLTSSVKLVVTDALSTRVRRRHRSGDTPDFAGSWLGRENRVDLMSDGTSLHTLTHELTHGLSSSRPRTVEVVSEDGQVTILPDLPTGFSEIAPQVVDGHVTELAVQQRRWLNEAVTESVTGELFAPRLEPNQNQTLMYPAERKLFALLLTKGKLEGALPSRALGIEGSLIPESVITEAYFEDRDPSLPLTQQRAKQKEFFHQIAELYSPGFLNRLDAVERLLGVDVAVAIMEHPGFDPKNDGIPFLQTKEQADLYLAELRARGVIA